MSDKIFIQDSAVLEASIDFDDPDVGATATGVDWLVVRPDNSNLIVPSFPAAPVVGERVINGNNLFEWNGSAWQNLGSSFLNILIGNDATGVIPGDAIDQVGLWRARARFVLDDGTTRSSLVNFEVFDPLAPVVAAGDSTLDWVVDHAWMKLEDLFDSEFGGPWLSDRTMKNFSKEKMIRLVPDALYYINNDSQPVTSFDETSFPLTQHKSLLAQGLLVESIYHLIRSYVEQPLPAGQTITYFDRRDYLQRWQQVLQTEEQKLQKLIDIFKLQFLGFGSSAILVGGYASSLVRTPQAYRTRYPRYVMPYRSL
jgi:hypothetical protein